MNESGGEGGARRGTGLLSGSEHLATWGAQWDFVPRHGPFRQRLSDAVSALIAVVTALSGFVGQAATLVDRSRRKAAAIPSSVAPDSVAESLLYDLKGLLLGDSEAGESRSALLFAVEKAGELAGQFRTLLSLWGDLQRDAQHRHASSHRLLKSLLEKGIQVLCEEVQRMLEELESSLKHCRDMASSESLSRVEAYGRDLERIRASIDNALQELQTVKRQLGIIGLLVVQQPAPTVAKHRQLDDSQASVRRPARRPRRVRPRAPLALRSLFPRLTPRPRLHTVLLREDAAKQLAKAQADGDLDTQHRIFERAESGDPAVTPCILKQNSSGAAFHDTADSPRCLTARIHSMEIEKVLSDPSDPISDKKLTPGRSYVCFRTTWDAEEDDPGRNAAGSSQAKPTKSAYVLSQATTILRHPESGRRRGVDAERWWDQVFFTRSGELFPEWAHGQRAPGLACPAYVERGVPWDDFKRLLNHKFQCLAGASHGGMDVRPLSDTGLAHISTYLFGNLSGQDPSNMFVTRETFFAQAKYTKLIFGHWFYAMAFVVEKHLFHFWNSFLIWPFTSKETARRILKEKDEASLLIKFSDTMEGTIIIAFRDPKGANPEVDFLRMDLGQMYQVRVDQSLYSTDLQPMKQLLRAFDALEIPLGDVLEEGKNQRDYYRFLVSGQLGPSPSPYDPLDASEVLLAQAYPPDQLAAMAASDSGFVSGGSRGRSAARPALAPQRPSPDPALAFNNAPNFVRSILAAAQAKHRRPVPDTKDSGHDSADSCDELDPVPGPQPRLPDFSACSVKDSGRGDSLADDASQDMARLRAH